MNIGTRLIYNQKGDILVMYGDVENTTLREEITELHSLDLEFGKIDLNQKRVVKVDTSVIPHQVVLEDVI